MSSDHPVDARSRSRCWTMSSCSAAPWPKADCDMTGVPVKMLKGRERPPLRRGLDEVYSSVASDPGRGFIA
jgi:hypothetical protein